jgi:transposase
VENYRLPKTEAARLEHAAVIGADGRRLLAAIDAAKEQPWLVQLPAVQVLRKVWVDQYVEEDGQLRWRSKAEMPAPASQVSSPYDPAARSARSWRAVDWDAVARPSDRQAVRFGHLMFVG